MICYKFYQQTFLQELFLMKKFNFYLPLFMLGAFICSLGAADQVKTQHSNGLTQEKFDIMERDENEDSDTLAIPLDDSEVEDEEELQNMGEKFGLPQEHPSK